MSGAEVRGERPCVVRDLTQTQRVTAGQRRTIDRIRIESSECVDERRVLQGVPVDSRL
jgi:hypothetical protein